LVLVLFVGYCFGEICVFVTAMSIRKVFFVFLSIKVMSGRLKGIFFFVRQCAAIPVQLEIFILQYNGWRVLIIWTFIVNQFGCLCQLLLLLLLLLVVVVVVVVVVVLNLFCVHF